MKYLLLSFPLQKWSHERATVLHYMAFASLVLVSPKAVRNAKIVFHAVWAVYIILLWETIFLLLSYKNIQTLKRQFVTFTFLNLMIRKCHDSVLLSHFSWFLHYIGFHSENPKHQSALPTHEKKVSLTLCFAYIYIYIYIYILFMVPCIILYSMK